MEGLLGSRHFGNRFLTTSEEERAVDGAFPVCFVDRSLILHAGSEPKAIRGERRSCLKLVGYSRKVAS